MPLTLLSLLAAGILSRRLTRSGLVQAWEAANVLPVPGDRFAASRRDGDSESGVAIEAVRRNDPATALVVATGRSNQGANRLPSVHLKPDDHGEADLQREQESETIAVRLRRVLFLDRGLALQPTGLSGVRRQLLIPGRLQLLDVPVPPQGLEVGRRGGWPF